jgi:hypothetical protein
MTNVVRFPMERVRLPYEHPEIYTPFIVAMFYPMALFGCLFVLAWAAAR